MKYKALMLDVDGTTIPNRRDGMPSEKVTHAIQRAKEKLHVGVVTGRHFPEAKPIINHLRLSGPCILNGGAQILHFPEGKVLWQQPLNRDVITKISQICAGYDVLISDGFSELNETQAKNNGSILSAAIVQITAQEAATLQSSLSSLASIALHTVPSWAIGKVDLLINHTSATKLHGIYEVAKILGINTHEIIGVGDGGNDMPLLMACGLKVAMGNANENLKAIADYIAPTVEEDGVADVIEKFILNSSS